MNPNQWKRLSVALFLALVAISTFSVTYATRPTQQASFQVKSRGYVEFNVDFVLFKHGQTIPDPYLVMGSWKVVNIAPEGIYYAESVHNTETNCFANYFQYMMAGNGVGAGHEAFQSTPNMYIALTTNSTAAGGSGTSGDIAECYLYGELTGNGEGRTLATATLNNTAVSGKASEFKAVVAFSITGGTNTLNKAGLTPYTVAVCAVNSSGSSQTVPGNGCYIAITAIPTPPAVINLDSFTATWKIDYTGS